MTTVRAQPQDKTSIVPVGNRTCAGQMHMWWDFGGGGENHMRVDVSEVSVDASVYKFSRRIYSCGGGQRGSRADDICRQH